jgi:23S rRNA (uracil1939-C5)-methyltransferase
MPTINLTIQKPAYGGYGLGFYNGKACFVQYAVPGDELTAEIYKEKKDYSFGRIIKLINRSEHRTEPECPNFGICGGCDYLNIDYDTELRFKKEILIETLKRSRIDEKNIPEISVVSAGRFHYRSHASIKSSKSTFGFFEKESNQIAGFPETGCLLLAEELLQKLDTLPKFGSEIKIACSGKSGCISSFDENGKIVENECGINYERDISLFFQSNKYLRKRMIEIVSEYTAINSSKSFIDIGCGVGFFTLYLVKSAKKAFGIDISKESISWAKRNAKLNGITNASFRTMPASQIGSLNERFEAVIADPPRPGLSSKAREAVKSMSPDRIVYVSCDPATFARDARDFTGSGYKLERLTMIDMFPGTHHIETISLFKRSA